MKRIFTNFSVSRTRFLFPSRSISFNPLIINNRGYFTPTNRELELFPQKIVGTPFFNLREYTKDTPIFEKKDWKGRTIDHVTSKATHHAQSSCHHGTKPCGIVGLSINYLLLLFLTCYLIRRYIRKRMMNELILMEKSLQEILISIKTPEDFEIAEEMISKMLYSLYLLHSYEGQSCKKKSLLPLNKTSITSDIELKLAILKNYSGTAYNIDISDLFGWRKVKDTSKKLITLAKRKPKTVKFEFTNDEIIYELTKARKDLKCGIKSNELIKESQRLKRKSEIFLFHLNNMESTLTKLLKLKVSVIEMLF